MSETPPFSPTIALLTVARAWEADLTDGLRTLGLTTRTYGLLGHVRSTPGISFSELARRSRITVQSAHTAVGTLQKKGWVSDASAHAGAASRLEVTPSGSDLLDDAAVVVSDLDARFAATLPGLSDALRAHLRLLMEASR